MSLTDALLAAQGLMSLGLLVGAIRLGSQYGRDSNRLEALEQQVEEVRGDVKTILGNGHPSAFVRPDVFEPVVDEVQSHRQRLHDLSNGHHALGGRVTKLEVEVATIREG